MGLVNWFNEGGGVNLSLTLIGVLFCVSLAAGFIDSIAGGGGLLCVPALLLAGFPPLVTLGTNKLQGLCGSGSASLAYARGGHVSVKQIIFPFVMSLLGSMLGSSLAGKVPTRWLEIALPILLILVAIYFLFKPDTGKLQKQRLMPNLLFNLSFIPLLGFYDGIFGPGTGSFFMLGFVLLAGMTTLQATAHTKFVNFASNIGALIIFALQGVVLWKLGLLMGLGQFLGAQAGSRLAMQKGSRLIRPLLVLVCLAITVKLLANDQAPLRLLIQSWL